MDPEVVEISLPVPWSLKSTSLKQKEVMHEVIDVDVDEDSTDVMLIDEKVYTKNKGKETLANFSNGHCSAAKRRSVDRVQSCKRSCVPGSHYSIKLDSFSLDLSYGSNEYMDMYYDDLTNDDKCATLQAHFDNIDIPPGVEVPIPWLSDPAQSKEAATGSSTCSSLRIQSDAVGFPPGTDWSSSWCLPEPAQLRKQSSLTSSSSLQTQMDAVSHSHGEELSLSWSLPEPAQSKKRLAASTSSTYSSLKTEKSTVNLLPGVEPLKPQCFLESSSNKKKPGLPGSATCYSSCQQLGTMKFSPGSELCSEDSYFPNHLKKQVGNGSITYPSFLSMDTTNRPPGVDASKSRCQDSLLSPDYSKFPPLSDAVHIFPEEESYVLWDQDPAKSKTNASAAGSSTIPIESASSRGNENDILEKFHLFKQFDTVQDHSDHHYSRCGSSMKQPSKNWAKKIQEEWRILEKDLPDKIFVRVYESRMDLLRAVIIGVEGTPYHDGLFFFDFFFPCNYPSIPPHVYYHSGGLRINPNLYNRGKVCLSLLNTWSGNQNEKWIPGVSTILQVLVSIQGLILNAKPYFNEPGFARMSDSANGEKNSQQYNENTFILSLKTMVYSMRRPPKHFEDFVVGHFFKRAHDILVACKAYMDGAQVGCLAGGVQDVDAGDKSCSQHFKQTLAGQSYYGPRISSLKFVLDGFWSESSGKLCMVGSASWHSKYGNSLNLDAVLKLNYAKNSTIATSLVSGTLESLSSDESNYFEPISILGLPSMSYYNYTLLSEGFDDGCPGGIDIPQNQSLSFQRGSVCSMLSIQSHTFELEYESECTSSQNCTPFGGGIGYLPRVMSLHPIQCSEGEQKLRYLVEFPTSSYTRHFQPSTLNATLVGEGAWHPRKNQLCISACRILNVTDSLGNAYIGDCSIKMSLRYPAAWTIRNRTIIMGHIWTNKTANDSGYFDRITFRSSENSMAGISGLRYEYTEIDKVRRSCPMKKKPVKKRGKRYPGEFSYDMRFDMLVKNSRGKFAWGSAVPISVGGQFYEPSPVTIWGSALENAAVERTPVVKADPGYSGTLNISYKISISSSNLSLSSNGHVEISAEGIYDAKTGYLCMVGCRKLGSYIQKSTKDSVDCEILVNSQFPPLNSKKGGVIKGSIRSTRKITDPLYFEHLSMSSNVLYTVAAKQAIWRMDLETTMVLIFEHACMCLCALFLKNPNQQNVLLGSGGWLEVNEVIVRVVTMVAFLLQFRLLQLAWSAATGYRSMLNSLGSVVYEQLSLWEDLGSYASLVLDGFLFPQILLNIFQISRESALSHSFYIGTTFVRLLPHAYDLYRAHNYFIGSVEWSHIYANPTSVFYSTTWDIIISCGGMLFAAIIYLQQRFGGRILSRKLEELEAYEKVPAVSND
ncbi:hypothetical protein F0562_008938 [Nyssa sinensis]|uniref:UBC core domain-containing protein n=1 Tax=Nyssa sinensis TaxID=561372 RepID=A0A5J5A7G0_9ASTE|nr:hypothetical protein F0562_008938 [Nyssa sinensis]